jgi:predicted nucleic acid-binding protein
MPSTDPHHVYWDSCVFLSIFNNHPDRHPTLRIILDEVRASRGSLKIYTSVLSLTEVAFITQEQEQRQLGETTIATMDGLMGDQTLIQLIEVNRYIAILARSYIRTAMIDRRSLKPPDAIHLASAVYAKVGQFQTYDGKLYPLKQVLSLEIPINAPTTFSHLPLFNPPNP